MKAGFGRYDITPKVGCELYGFGVFRNRCSVAVHDILEARVGIFEQDGKKIAFISCDICTLTANIVTTCRRLIRERHPEFQDHEIMIHASHTHSGPSPQEHDYGWGAPDPAWVMLLPYRLREAFTRAWENMQDVTLSQALVPCRQIGLNRVHDKDCPPLSEVYDPNWEPAMPELTDTVCRVIRIDSVPEGKMIGFMAYFGCHPVVGYATNHYIHGDFPAVAIHKLMQEFPGSTGLFVQGAQGDVNSAGAGDHSQTDSLAALDVIANRFAAAIRNGLQQAEKLEDTSISVISRQVPFKTKMIFTPEVIEQIRREESAKLQDPEVDERRREIRLAVVYLRGLTKVEERMKDPKDIMAELHIVRIGDLEFIGTPFEVMQAIKNDVHAVSTARYPMLMSLANGGMGYAPDNDALANSQKGYALYAARYTPLIVGRLPYADIHNEIVHYVKELEKELS